MGSDYVRVAREALAEAPLDSSRWSEALTAIAAIGGGWGAQLLGLSAEGDILFHHSAGVPLDMAQAFERLGGADPAVNPRARILHAPPLQVLGDFDLALPEELATNLFYQSFLKTRDAPFFAGARLAGANNQQIVLVVSRDEAQGHLQEGEGLALQELLPDLARAIQLQQKLEQDGLALTAETFDAARVAALICSGAGRVIAMTRSAERQLSSVDGVLTLKRGGRLAAAKGVSDDGLQAALKHATDSALAQDARGASTVPLLGPNGNFRVIEVAPLPRRRFSMGCENACIVLLGRESGRDSSELLMPLFSLSRAEAAIAVSLAQGVEIADIAKQRSVSVATVRNQRKLLFAKLGVNSRAELTRILGPLVWRV